MTRRLLLTNAVTCQVDLTSSSSLYFLLQLHFSHSTSYRLRSKMIAYVDSKNAEFSDINLSG